MNLQTNARRHQCREIRFGRLVYILGNSFAKEAKAVLASKLSSRSCETRLTREEANLQNLYSLTFS